MIIKLENKNEETAQQIRALFQASYKIEAELLNAIDFPPLNRELEDFINCDTEFYGLSKGEEIAAVVEVKADKEVTDIHSLVVLPNYFRQGLGRELVQFVLDTFDSESYIVETGLENEPATRLYKQLGFVEQSQWDTPFGIRKVGFKKTRQRR